MYTVAVMVQDRANRVSGEAVKILEQEQATSLVKNLQTTLGYLDKHHVNKPRNWE